jgi:hypothetical protein
MNIIFMTWRFYDGISRLGFQSYKATGMDRIRGTVPVQDLRQVPIFSINRLGEIHRL